MVPPEIVYKYRAFNQFLLMELINQSVWFSSPVRLNDPFDCQFVLEDCAPTKDDFEKRKMVAMQRYAESIGGRAEVTDLGGGFYYGGELAEECKLEVGRFKKHIENNLRDVGVFSVSEESTNTTMWSHYAASHTGVCIGYFTGKLFPKNNLEEMIHQVRYVPSSEIRFNAYDIYADCCCNYDKKAYDDIVNDLMSTKSTDWSYEKEWRFVHEVESGIHIGADSIHSIRFGLRTKPEEKSTIRNILANVPMLFFQMIPSKAGLGLKSVHMDRRSKYWAQYP